MFTRIDDYLSGQKVNPAGLESKFDICKVTTFRR
jgi:hypothetical protein